MDRLWAPWRLNYIRSGVKQKGCIFCWAKKSRESKQVIFKTKYSVVMLNIYPYNNGHLLVSPKRHTNDIAKLNEIEVLDLFKAVKEAKHILDKVLSPHGYNVGFNLGRAAGAGIPQHVHVHIVPRWKGDSNFMPVLFGTKIISQSLDDLFKRLRKAMNCDAYKRTH